MKRTITIFAALAVVATASVAYADHIPTIPVPNTGAALAVPLLDLGDVTPISNVAAAQAPAAPFGETDPFTRDGRTYTITSSMWYGLQVLDITDPLRPTIVGTYSSATTCPSVVGTPATGGPLLDPLGVQGGWENDLAFTPDGRIAILGQDADGRCHDPASGGIELIDVSDVTNPRLLHLTRNVGEAHSITIDPAHPWLAYLSTSEFNRDDHIDIVDFRSCLGGVADVASCKPSVARAVLDEQYYPSLANTETDDPNDDLIGDGCHDIRFAGERAFCASVEDGSLIFDTSRVVNTDGELTGTHLTAGEHACPMLDADLGFAPGVTITDCLDWTGTAFTQRDAQPVDLPLVSWVSHRGGGSPLVDVSIAHQTELIADGRIMIVTDERGGGLTNDAGCPGGGAHFYDVRDESNPVRMQLEDGSPAVYLTELNLPGSAHMSCTIHYGEEFQDENLLVFGWYLNGWRVVRYDVDWDTTPATVSFTEVAAFTPAGGEVIQAKGLMRNPENLEEIIIYTADLFRGVDVYTAVVPRITREEAFGAAGGTAQSGGGGGKADGGTKVLGARQNLPATGADDPVTLALIVLTLAIGLTTRIRKVRI